MEIKVWVVTYTTWSDDEHELYNEVQVCASKEEAVKVLKQYKRSELDSGHFSFDMRMSLTVIRTGFFRSPPM